MREVLRSSNQRDDCPSRLFSLGRVVHCFRAVISDKRIINPLLSRRSLYSQVEIEAGFVVVGCPEQKDALQTRSRVSSTLGGDYSRSSEKMENTIDNQVLVVYATKYGATAEIAEKIGQVLREAGLHTDVLPTDRVGDLAPYQAVVLGSAIYIGKWRKEAVKFLQANEKMLAERPVWLFSSGPTGEGDPVKLLRGWHFPKAQQPIADRIQPRDIAVFHGVLDMKKLNFIEKWIIKNVKAPLGDFRDWDAIASWATAIADVLKGGAGTSGVDS